MKVLARLLAAAVLCLVLAGCRTQLYGNLSEQEANAVLAALLDASIAAEKRSGEEGTYSVFVDADDFANAVRVLNSDALPRRRFDDLGKVFGGEAMFSTPMEEKARYLYAMQEELSHTVSQIDGVLSARVHLVLPEQDQLGRELQTPSAAVMVRYGAEDERFYEAAHQSDIRRLVAAAVPNLAEEKIVVTFFSVQTPAKKPASPPLRTVLGIRVAADSATRLWWMAGGAAAAILACAAAGVFAVRRARRGKGEA